MFENFLIRKQQQRSPAAWRYRWLACVLSQVERTSSPGSRPRQFFPSLPTPRTILLIPLKKPSSTASAEEFYYSFFHNEGIENKL